MPRTKLRSKVLRLRSDFRSISSEREFAEYLAATPPDLTTEHDAISITFDQYKSLLRDDLKDLLSRIYMKYAILPAVTGLALLAARLCLVLVITLLFVLLVMFVAPLIMEMGSLPPGVSPLNIFLNSSTLSSLTIFVVVLGGASGGWSAPCSGSNPLSPMGPPV